MLRVGIDFGGTKIAYGLFDDSLNMLDRLRVKTDAGAEPSAVVNAMAEDVRSLVRRGGHSMDEVAGVGIGFPSHIDFDDGRVIIATNLPPWEEFPLRDELSARLSLPVWLDNDTNTAAIAEHRIGAGQGARHMIYLTISTGIGCGFIINDAPYRGSHGFAGELGQMFVSDTEGYETPRMNAGVVQSIASGPQLARRAREHIAAGRESAILRHAGSLEAVDCQHIGLALAEGDALAGEITDYAARYIGRMLVSFFEAMDIGVIVYGGGVTKLGPRLVDGMIGQFYALSHSARRRPVDFRPAALGDDAGLIGAALIAAPA